MITTTFYNIEADNGHVLRNRYSQELRHYVENETDLDAWEEIELEEPTEEEQQ